MKSNYRLTATPIINPALHLQITGCLDGFTGGSAAERERR